MNIGELFVNLGIKGAEKTVGALSNVGKNLGQVSTASLEAKAGVLALLYGLERMTAISGKAGTGLTNFAALTGLSTQNLQKWQYAARQAGESNEELTSSLEGVQNNMAKAIMGKGAPEGFGIVKNAVGLDQNRLRDTFYVMTQLQKAAQQLPKDLGNQVLKSFGLSEATIAAMRRGVFNEGNFKNAPEYSEKEIQALNRSNIAWSNLFTKIEMAFGKFNAAHGGQLVKDIDMIFKSVMKVVNSLERMAEKFKLFSVVSDMFQGLNILLGLVDTGVDKVSSKLGDGKGRTPEEQKEYEKGNFLDHLADAIAKGISAHTDDDGKFHFLADKYKDPTLGGTKTVTVNQSIYGVDHNDKKKVGDTHKTAATHAYHQRPNFQGN